MLCRLLPGLWDSRVEVQRPPEICIAAAGSVMKEGIVFCREGFRKIGVLFPYSDFSPSDSSSVYLPSTGYSTELVELPESSL